MKNPFHCVTTNEQKVRFPVIKYKKRLNPLVCWLNENQNFQLVFSLSVTELKANISQGHHPTVGCFLNKQNGRSGLMSLRWMKQYPDDGFSYRCALLDNRDNSQFLCLLCSSCIREWPFFIAIIISSVVKFVVVVVFLYSFQIKKDILK